MSSLELVERMRAKHDILMVPGEHFGLPFHLRMSYGNEREELAAALDEVKQAFGRMLMD